MTQAASDWRRANPARVKVHNGKYYYDLRVKLYNHYGGRCACCGETDWHFLTIEHINGLPDRHRSSSGKRASPGVIMGRIIQDGYPDYIELLCWNCNQARKQWGSCPHRSGPVRYRDGELIPITREEPLPTRERSTHCARGHEYDYVQPGTGWQQCRICHRDAARKRRAKVLSGPVTDKC